jgi:tetratricopeptide (TPR) repeat protein
VLWIQIRLGASDEEARSLFTEARELALRSGDRPALARELWSYGVYNLYAGGSVDRALELLIPAVETADESDDDDLRMATRFGLNLAQYFGGRLVEARTTAEEAVAIGAGDVQVGMEILGYSGLVFMNGMLGAELAYQGHWREAEAALQDAVVLDARAGGTAAVTAGLGQSFWSIHALLTGAVSNALAHIQRGVERVAEVQTPAGEVFIMRQLGIMYAVDGQWDRAAQALDRSHQVLRERRTFRQAEGELLAWRALVHLEQGEPDQAEAVVEQAREVCRATGARLEAVMAEILRARILRRTRGAKARQEVEPALEAGLALAREVGSRLHEVWILEECGALARAVGDAAACGQHLGEAERLYREMDLPEQAERIHGLLQADR